MYQPRTAGALRHFFEFNSNRKVPLPFPLPLLNARLIHRNLPLRNGFLMFLV